LHVLRTPHAGAAGDRPLVSSLCPSIDHVCVVDRLPMLFRYMVMFAPSSANCRSNGFDVCSCPRFRVGQVKPILPPRHPRQDMCPQKFPAASVAVTIIGSDPSGTLLFELKVPLADGVDVQSLVDFTSEIRAVCMHLILHVQVLFGLIRRVRDTSDVPSPPRGYRPR